MRARFSVTKGKDVGKSFYVTEGKPITLGRSSAADIALSEPRISRIHCRLTHDGKHIMLTDLNSTNGTYVNERKIKSVPLADMDAIRIGDTVIVIKLEEGEEPKPIVTEKQPSLQKKASVEEPEAPAKPKASRVTSEDVTASRMAAGRKPEEAGPSKASEMEGSVMGLFDKWLDEPHKRAAERAAPEAPARGRERGPGAPAGRLDIPGVELRKKTKEDATGETYEGFQIFLSRPVSVRVLSSALAQEKGPSKDFQEWAGLNAGLLHPNIIQVYDAGKCGDTYYAVSEVPEGLPIEALMTRDGARRALNANLAIEIALQLARALRHAHAQKAVHWDLRPGTIFISRERVVKIGGFSLPEKMARKAAAGGEMTSVLPVHPYLAPELIHDVDIADARADIYGLAAVFYDMVCGRPPFQSDFERRLVEMILRERPETPQKHNASLPPETCLLILKGLAKDPANRYASASDLVKELKALPRVKGAAEEE